MLQILDIAMDWATEAATVVGEVQGRNARLADQLQRSSLSVVLNLAEGMGAIGKSKIRSYRIALGEMRESVTALEMAFRLGYASRLGAGSVDRQERIVATLVRLARVAG
jgi:four helix bundle protein